MTTEPAIEVCDLPAPQEHARWLREVLPTLRGTVLDVGAGSGSAGPALHPSARWIALEPKPSRRLTRAVANRPDSRILAATAEDLPLADASIDAVVCSMVLCSVADPESALAEIRRVLRPGGTFVFFEHVAAPAGSGARRMQRLVRPLTRMLDHGCDPCRDTTTALHHAGFPQLDLRTLRTAGVFGGLGPIIVARATV